MSLKPEMGIHSFFLASFDLNLLSKEHVLPVGDRATPWEAMAKLFFCLFGWLLLNLLNQYLPNLYVTELVTFLEHQLMCFRTFWKTQFEEP